MNYKKNPNYELKEIAGETILIPRGAATVDFNSVTVFNETGALLLKAMDEAADIDSLAGILVVILFTAGRKANEHQCSQQQCQ